MLTFIIGFVCVWAAFELFSSLVNFTSFGETAIGSFSATGAVFGFGFLIYTTVQHVEVESDQETLLEEQWSDDDEADVTVTIKMEEHEREEIKEFFNERDQEQKEDIEQASSHFKERTVPANRAYVDASRRRYDETVSYNPDTREACSESVGCFRAQLIQHKDGSFWACRRNYGACYEY